MKLLRGLLFSRHFIRCAVRVGSEFSSSFIGGVFGHGRHPLREKKKNMMEEEVESHVRNFEIFSLNLICNLQTGDIHDHYVALSAHLHYGMFFQTNSISTNYDTSARSK